MGTAARKKKERKKASSSAISPRKLKQSRLGPNNLIVLEDVVLGLLFFSLVLLFSTVNLVHFTLPKLVALRLGSLALILLFGRRLLKGQIRPVPRTILLIGAALGLWWIGTTFFALHTPTALNGYFGRYNGLWTHLNYLILFFMAAAIPMEDKRIDRIGWIFIAALIPVSLYAVIQYFQLDPFPWSTRWSRSVSTIGHGVPLAALLGMAMPFIIIFIFKAETYQRKGGLLILLLIFLAAMLSTLSRGPWLAAFIASIGVIVFGVRDLYASRPASPPPNSPPPPFLSGNEGELIKGLRRLNRGLNFSRQTKKIILGLLICLVLFGALLFFSGSSQKITDRFKTFTQLELDTSFGGRLLYYRAALKGIKDHPVAGIGFENLRNIYPHYRVPEDNLIFVDTIPTMVHNGYLQIALENGLPGFALYLALITLVLFRLIEHYRRTNSPLSLALIGTLICFLIQDVSGWPDIALTPFLWLFLGLALSYSQGNRANVTPPARKKTGLWVRAFCLLSIFFLAALTIDGVRMFSGDRLFGLSRFLSIEQDWPKLESNLLQGLKRLPREAAYEDTAGLYYLERFAKDHDLKIYQKGAAILEQAHKDNPFDPYVLIHRIDLDWMALGFGVISGTSDYVQKAIGRLLKMDRNNRTVYIALSRLQIREKKFSVALNLIEAGNWLNRGAPNPREEWTEAWQGLFFEQVKKRDFPAALKILKEILTQYPDDVPSYVLMGNLFEAMQNPAKAREAFNSALKLEPENKEAQEGLNRLKP